MRPGHRKAGMPDKKAHGSRTLADLSPEERTRFDSTVSKYGLSGDHLKIAKNLASKYGLDYGDLLGILSRARRAVL